MRQLIAGLTLVTLAGQAAAQDWDAVEMKLTDLGHGIYMLEGRGGNIGLSVGDDGVFMIDDQYAPLSARIEAAVREVSADPVRFVINTHWHGDHTGGNEHFGETGAVIVAHHNVRQRMSTDQFLEAFDRTIEASPEGALPIVTFTDSIRFHLNGQTIDVFHTDPAHTDGDSMVYFREADVLHMGDVYFQGRFPFVDVSSGGSAKGYLKVIDGVLGKVTDSTRIIPGHGRLSNRAELSAYRDALAEVINTIETLIDEGKSLDEIKAAGPAGAYADSYGSGFINADTFVELVHASLTGGY